MFCQSLEAVQNNYRRDGIIKYKKVEFSSLSVAAQVASVAEERHESASAKLKIAPVVLIGEAPKFRNRPNRRETGPKC